MADIKAGRYRHIKIGGLAVLITLLFGVGVAAISIWPMMDLVAFVHRIHQGDLEHELKLEYSKDRVRNLIRRLAGLSAADISEQINTELSRFVGAKSPDDDLTFVIVKVP